jgi:hypothetical protein
MVILVSRSEEMEMSIPIDVENEGNPMGIHIDVVYPKYVEVKDRGDYVVLYFNDGYGMLVKVYFVSKDNLIDVLRQVIKQLEEMKKNEQKAV